MQVVNVGDQQVPVNSQGYTIFPFRFTNPYRVVTDSGLDDCQSYELKLGGVVATKLPGEVPGTTPLSQYGGAFSGFDALDTDVLFGSLFFSLPGSDADSDSSDSDDRVVFTIKPFGPTARASP